jgi:hypothetical protein
MKKVIVILTLSFVFSALFLLTQQKESNACSAVEFELTQTGTSCGLFPIVETIVYIVPNSCLENSCSGSGEYMVQIRNSAGNIVFSQEAVNYQVAINPCSVLRVPNSGCANFYIEVSFYCNGVKVAGSTSSQLYQVCA